MLQKKARGDGRPQRPSDHEHMWEALLLTGWSFLVVIPVDPTTPSASVFDALSTVLASKSEASLEVVDGRGASIKDGNRLAEEISAKVGKGRRVVAFVDAITQSLAGVPLVREADSALLLVQVGFPDVESLSSTLSIVGVDRVVGSVTVPAPE